MKPSDYIRRGWCQHELFCTASGKATTRSEAEFCCALGAIELAATSPEEVAAMRARLEIVIGRSIAKWNDDPSRTEEEVIAAFEKAGL